MSSERLDETRGRWSTMGARPVILLVPALAAIVAMSCGSRTGLPIPSAPAAPPCTASSGNAGPMPMCDSGSTTLSGTVYDPAGKNPLYNVVVYVPGGTPDTLPSGATCDSCSDLYTGSPIATALTDAQGRFVLTNVPAGPAVPLVLQIGKWRRQLRIASVTASRTTSCRTER